MHNFQRSQQFQMLLPPQRTGPGTLLKTAHTNITKSILLKFLCNWDLQMSGIKDMRKLVKSYCNKR
jgi:hypothetical protein